MTDSFYTSCKFDIILKLLHPTVQCPQNLKILELGLIKRMKIYSRQACEIDSFDVYKKIYSFTKVELIMMVL